MPFEVLLKEGDLVMFKVSDDILKAGIDLTRAYEVRHVLDLSPQCVLLAGVMGVFRTSRFIILCSKQNSDAKDKFFN